MAVRCYCLHVVGRVLQGCGLAAGANDALKVQGPKQGRLRVPPKL